MNRSLAGAAVLSFGLMASGCALRYSCPALQCGEKPAAANLSDHLIDNEIANLVDRTKAAGMVRQKVEISNNNGNANVSRIDTNYNMQAFEDFLKERLNAGIGPSANTCIKNHVIQNIVWNIDEAMLAGSSRQFSMLENTWRNAISCGGSKESRKQQIQSQWDSSANALRQLQFTPVR